MSEYAVIFTLSAQVTEDSYKVFSHVLKCNADTTLAQIMEWKASIGNGATPISLTITALESLS